MLRQLLFLFGILLVAGGCQQRDDASVTPVSRARIADGQYVGTFQRATPTGKFATANVLLTLQDGRFSGSSDQDRYPAIGSGTYTQTDAAITFVNENMWTADFDWTLILTGEFSRTVDSDGTLVLQKKQGEGSYDTYRLRAQ